MEMGMGIVLGIIGLLVGVRLSICWIRSTMLMSGNGCRLPEKVSSWWTATKAASSAPSSNNPQWSKNRAAPQKSAQELATNSSTNLSPLSQPQAPKNCQQNNLSITCPAAIISTMRPISTCTRIGKRRRSRISVIARLWTWLGFWWTRRFRLLGIVGSWRGFIVVCLRWRVRHYWLMSRLFCSISVACRSTPASSNPV